MSYKLIGHSPDLKKLRDEGYEIEIKNTYLLVSNIPYVNSQKVICRGVLVMAIGNISGDRVGRPHDHTCHFMGETPCDKNGFVITGIINSSGRHRLAEGIEVDHYFSAKPVSGNYNDFYEKVTSYIKILASPAETIDDTVTAKSFKVIESSDSDNVFAYLDTNSSRAEIDLISDKLKNLKIAIIGLGGTGSYVLDFVSKTKAGEIHLFDGDRLLSHNAFRAPGAASLTTLRDGPLKVAYFCEIYSRMHLHIIAHEHYISESTLDNLCGMDFVFICIDNCEIKKSIIHKLLNAGIPFVDSGIGIADIDGRLSGSVRMTTATVGKSDHIETRISFLADGEDDYQTNIQIAEINALNAALAVIKWKKLFGYYHDMENEHNMVYTINNNQMINEDGPIA